MEGYQLSNFTEVQFSVAMTESLDQILSDHLDKGPHQEDLTFAYWRPSRGRSRYTAILTEAALPGDDERILQGNVSFTQKYLRRVLQEHPGGTGIALLHSHLGPGWQDMSEDDKVAERDRMGGAVAARTGLPILGLTRGTDGTWSGRFWLRTGPNAYTRQWAATVRVVGKQLRISHHPELSPDPAANERQVATVSVWGKQAQADLVRSHVGIVGLGSVGSIASESLCRTGLQHVTLIDHDIIEERNLDRTLGATPTDLGLAKVQVAQRTARGSHTAALIKVDAIQADLRSELGLTAALDCDAILSCVDRPFPRHLLNTIAKAHLIPVVDGGILARVDEAGRPVHIDWRIHTVDPSRRCLYCLGALRRSDVSLDRDGMLDDPDYIANLPQNERELVGRRNVFAFSLSVAAHQTLQLVGLVTGMRRIGGIGPQHYYAYPGKMTAIDDGVCEEDCEINELTATAVDLSSNIKPGLPQQQIAEGDDVVSTDEGWPSRLQALARRLLRRLRSAAPR